jgi:hypothetical protein
MLITDKILMGLNTMYVLGSLIALSMVIFTLSKRRMQQRKRFRDTNQFRHFEEKNDKARLLMLRLSLALTFVNVLYWGSDIITNLSFYFEMEYQGMKFFWVTYSSLYAEFIPLRGFVHFVAIWIALKWDLIKNLFRKDNTATAIPAPRPVTEVGHQSVKSDSKMERSLQFGSHGRCVQRDTGEVVTVTIEPNSTVLETSRTDLQPIAIPIPPAILNSDTIGSRRLSLPASIAPMSRGTP